MLSEFTTNLSLQGHVNAHKGLKPYVCELCPAKFSHQNFMTKHRNEVHNIAGKNAPYKFKKPTESKSFRQKMTAKLPQNEAHKLTVKSMLCQYCGKNIPLPTYHRHQNMHTGKKPYACDLCPFSTIYRLSLTVHMRIHTGETPYKCTYCPKAFKQQQQLNQHIRFHKNIRKYQCKLCDKRFGSKGNLSQHELRHKRHTPFYCHVCGMGYYTSSARKRHVEAKHGQDEVENIRKHQWRKD